MIRDRSAAMLLLMIAGFVIWSSAFICLYAVLSVGCAYGWEARSFGPFSLLRSMLIALWLVHLAAIAALLAWSRRRAGRSDVDGDGTARFLRGSVLGASVVALAMTVFNYGPILALSLCR